MIKHQLTLMGARIDLAIDQGEKDAFLMQKVIEQLYDYEKRYSANRPDSQLSAINQAAGERAVYVPNDLFQLIQIGLSHSRPQESYLNIAIGPLVQLWRIGFSNAQKPAPEVIAQALALVDPSQIILDMQLQTVYLAKAGMKLDLGALAKGYFADKIMAYLKSQGVRTSMINLGGNFLSYGPSFHKERDYWTVGLQDPNRKRGETLMTFKVKDLSVVTSGVYERVLKVGEETYHHIFDSQTGYPLKAQIKSLTIIAKSSLSCEIWTTRLFGLAPEEILDQIEATPGIQGAVVTLDNQVLVSSGIQADGWVNLN